LRENIRHIFFDLDRTLWDFEANSREALNDVYHQLELSRPGQGDSQYFIERYLMHNDHMWELYRAEKVTKGRLRKERFKRALVDIGVDDNRLVNLTAKTYMEVCPRKTRLVEGALDIVKALHGEYKLHILTNGFQEAQTTKLEVTGLAAYFDQVITSERASSRKPQPRIYEVAQLVSGAKPEESLMIGDHLDIDVKGAINAGWSAIHYNCDKEKHDLPSIQRLDELRGLLL